MCILAVSIHIQQNLTKTVSTKGKGRPAENAWKTNPSVGFRLPTFFSHVNRQTRSCTCHTGSLVEAQGKFQNSWEQPRGRNCKNLQFASIWCVHALVLIITPACRLTVAISSGFYFLSCSAEHLHVHIQCVLHAMRMYTKFNFSS